MEDDGISSGSLAARENAAQSTVEASLPEDLTRKVIARLPYPEIIQARCLSKRWRQLLSTDSADVEAEALHREVASVSSSWPSLAPVVKCGKCLCGYDSVSRTWKRIASLSSTQRAAFKFVRTDEQGLYPYESTDRRVTGGFEEVVVKVQCAGSLVCYFKDTRTYQSRGGYRYIRGKHKIMIQNLLTGSAKVIKAPSVTKDGQWWINGRLFHILADGFMIVLVYANQTAPHLDLVLQVFDSREGRWCIDVIEELDCIYSSMAYGDRVKCYPQLLEGCKLRINTIGHCYKFIVGEFDCLAKVWRHDAMSGALSSAVQELVSVLLCGSRVIIVRESYGSFPLTLRLFEYDETVGSVVTLDEGHVVEVDCLEELSFSSDENHIYVGVFPLYRRKQTILSYNVTRGRWRKLLNSMGIFSQKRTQKIRWLDGSYSPGLNPFYNPSQILDRAVDRKRRLEV